MNVNPIIRYNRITITVLIYAFICTNAYGGYNFNSGFFKSVGLSDADKEVNLDVFNQGAEFLPGTYQMSVYVNGKYIKKTDISFLLHSSDKKLELCLKQSDFDSFGIELPWQSLGECFNTDGVIKVDWKVDINSMRLDIILPQIYVKHGDHFLTPWQSWEQGATVAMLNYDYNFNSSKGAKNNSENQYLGLENGLNILGFRLRNQSVWTKSSKGQDSFDALRTYLQKDYHYLQGGEFTAGKIYSDGGFFESIPLNGFMLSTNDQMLKSSFRDFTPEVRGVVQSSSALVSVVKNGTIIYQTTLPTGPFALEGIMTNGGGEYEIRVSESDGSIRIYSQSAESIPELLSPGRFKYNFTSGKTDFTKTDNSYFGQLYLGYGVNGWYTLYGGTIFSSDYLSTGFGNGFLINGFGALSADLTLSKARFEKDKKTNSGKSLRASYYKDLDSTGTSLGLFAYRYSSENYLQFDEYLNELSGYKINNKKNKVEIVVRQKLANVGYLTFSGNRQSYWTNQKNDTGINLGYNTSFGRVSFNSYYEQEHLSNGRKDKTLGVLLTYSMYEQGKGFSLSSRFSHEKSSQGYQNSINISPFESGDLNIAANSFVKNNGDNHYGFFTSYRGSVADTSAGYDKSENLERINTSIRGSGVIHANGVTLGKRMSMNMPAAIISTSGISGIKVNNQNNTVTDFFGNALVTNLQPYQENKISIDVTSLDKNLDLIETNKLVIPRKGSVIPVNFDISRGERAVFSVKHKGKVIPLGAIASVSSTGNDIKTSFFADNGQVYFAGIDKKGIVNVKWGSSMSSQCSFQFSLENETQNYIHNKLIECR